MAAQLIPLAQNPFSLPPIGLPRPITLIGRHIECDARLQFAQISRRHCCIVQINRQWMVRDLGSRNGVHVNGQRVRTEMALRNGDEIAIGHLLYRVEASPDAA